MVTAIDARRASEPRRIRAVLFDLLMAVMNSPDVWTRTAGDRRRGLEWRDAATARMVTAGRYTPYENLVAAAARDTALPGSVVPELLRRWREMEPWPDAAALAKLSLPYGFLTNCSRALAEAAAARSGLMPAVVLSAEEVGWYKPDARAYVAGCRRLGLPASEVAFVAGAPYDAAGATQVGLVSWLVRRRADQPLPTASVTIASSLDDVVAGLDRTSP